ncbi:hypothetical protein [Bosea sp. (in: a-proteobacteria)]|uniref:hypothetical protein n=1 Tax=Bosea sp. (in: a-proteobacteria) TaxID=1871050 RepID=UPI00273573FB|nr:hypothetical protein [Bosea sp. (in: a-proteobacteria)]MDP3410127.1 hypothetical protein [Bosea sp. (in: a-proteobacteria)]
MTIKKLDTTKPTPIARPTTTKQPIQRQPPPRRPVNTRDELSTGRGRALRDAIPSAPMSDVQQLRALRAQSVKAGAAVSKLNAGIAAGVTATAVPEAVRQKAEQNLEMVSSTSQFAHALERETDPAVRDEMVRQALNSDHPELYLAAGDVPGATINNELDEISTVSAAVDHAVRSGAVTQTDMNTAVEKMGPDSAALFIGNLSIEGNNRALGGAVEMAGLAAREQGFEQAEALAFTSTDSLIDKYYPTDAQQKAAFEHVEAFVEEWDDRLGADENNPAIPHNALQFALGSAARLTARGNGYGPGELEEELKELGPRFTQETIARLGEATRFDGRVPGAIDSLADAADAIATAGGDKADEFRVAASIGYTQTPQLIHENLETEAEQREALESLNGFLADRRDQFGDAANGDPPYSLLRDPQAIEGINNLLSASPQLLEDLVNDRSYEPNILKPGESQATLVQLLESISFNPNVPAELREQFQGNIDRLMERTMASVADDPSAAGRTIGQLLGIVQTAGNRVIDAADDNPEEGSAVRDFAKDVTSGIIGAALSATGPVGSILGGAVLNQVLDAVFQAPPGPSDAELRSKVDQWLADNGINVSSGESSFDAINRALDATIEALRDVKPMTQAIRDQMEELETLRDVVGSSYSATQLSEQGAGGELAGALDGRDDKP